MPPTKLLRSTVFHAPESTLGALLTLGHADCVQEKQVGGRPVIQRPNAAGAA
jgi:hypothetical protein